MGVLGDFGPLNVIIHRRDHKRHILVLKADRISFSFSVPKKARLFIFRPFIFRPKRQRSFGIFIFRSEQSYFRP